MNTELKALIALFFDAYKAGQLAAAKANFVTSILPALYHVASDFPSVISNWNDLSAEIQALPGSAQEADLVAFVGSEFAGIVPSAHSQAVLSAVLKLISDLATDVIALEKTIKGS